MDKKYIVTLQDGERHDLNRLYQLFEGQSQEEIDKILATLNLSSIVVGSNNSSSAFSVDITADKSTVIKSDYDVTLTAELYEYFNEADDKAVNYKWFRDSGDESSDEEFSNNAPNTRTLKLSEESFGGDFNNTDVTFKVEVEVDGGYIIKDKIIFTKLAKLSRVQIEASDYAFINNSPDKITLKSKPDEGLTITHYKWYVNDNFVSSSPNYTLYPTAIPDNKAVTVKLEATDKSGSEYTDGMSIPKFLPAKDGEDGVPGESGEDGLPRYTWIKYADDEVGHGMQDMPFDEEGNAKEYIGLAYNKISPIESEHPEDYVWSKFVGSDGVPGENGYMWIKYSRWPKGRDTNGTIEMFDSPWVYIECGCTDPTKGEDREDMVYMGIAYNKQEKEESMTPEDYQWAKIKGDDGHTGYTLDLSNDSVSIPADGSGNIQNPEIAFSLAKTEITVYYGNDLVDPSEYDLELTAVGVTYETANNNHNIHITGMSGDVGEVQIKLVSDDKERRQLASDTFSVSKVRGLSAYEIMPSTNVFKISSTKGEPVLDPKNILVKIKENTGMSINDVKDGTLTYRYIFDSTIDGDFDGNPMPIDELFEISVNEANSPRFLELKYFRSTTTQDKVLIDKERIPFVKDGISGTFEESRYAKTGSFTIIPPLVDTDPDPKGWTKEPPAVSGTEILYMIKCTKDTETKALIGKWSKPVRISGPAGPQGPPGPAGSSATQSNLFIAPMGQWRSDRQYVGTQTRVEAVWWGNSWYVTIQGIGNVPIGTLPTNTSYWNKSQENYDFIATGLFLASSAWIDNLGINNLNTNPPRIRDNGSYVDNPKRIEITSTKNSLEFFTGLERFDGSDIGNDTNRPQPTVRLDAVTVENAVSPRDTNPGQKSKAGLIFNTERDGQVSYIGTEGIVSSGRYLNIPGEYDSSTAILGVSGGYNSSTIYNTPTLNVAVAGITTMIDDDNRRGDNFGGFFDNLAIRSLSFKRPYDNTGIENGSYKLGATNGVVIVYAKNYTVHLPNLQKLEVNWNPETVAMFKIIKVNPGTLTIRWDNGVPMQVRGGVRNGSHSVTVRTVIDIYYDGKNWIFFGNEG